MNKESITSKHLYNNNNNNNNKINCLTLSSNFYLGCQVKVDVEFQNEVKILVHIITENRNRHASGPVHALPLIPLHLLLMKWCVNCTLCQNFFVNNESVCVAKLRESLNYTICQKSKASNSSCIRSEG